MVLLEKDFFPRAKVCGEFLSMEAQGYLRRVGCLDTVLAEGPAAIERARVFSPSGRRVEFALGGEALGLSRTVLDELLFRHAQDSGAAAFEGVEAVKIEPIPGGELLTLVRRGRDGQPQRLELRAGLVVEAAGRKPAPASRPRGSLFVGCKRRHRPASSAAAEGLRGRVEVHLFEGGYCGVSQIENGGVNVCFLAEERWLAALASPRWEAAAAAMSRSSPSLAGRLSTLLADGEPAAVARVAFDCAVAEESRRPRVGDAAGMIAPLCGDGQAMALESALLLADFMGGADRTALPAVWAETWRRRFRWRMRLGRGLQGFLSRPWAAEAAAAVLGRWPFLVHPILAATRGA